MKKSPLLPIPVWAFLGLSSLGICTDAVAEPVRREELPALPAGAPNPVTMSWALREYDNERYAEAAAGFAQIAAGKSKEPDLIVRRAEFFLGKSCFNLKRYPESQAAFAKVVQSGRGHPYFDKTLQWLAGLTRFLPASSGLLGLIGKYDKKDLEQPALEAARDELSYLMGQARSEQGNPQEARELLGKIPPASPFYERAKALLARLPPARPAQ